MPRKPIPPLVVSAPATSAPATPKPATSTPTTADAPAAKPATSHLFARGKEERRNMLTHEQIASDLDAFARAGGKIEVLGTTFTLKSIKAEPAKPTKPNTSSKDKATPSDDSQDA